MATVASCIDAQSDKLKKQTINYWNWRMEFELTHEQRSGNGQQQIDA